MWSQVCVPSYHEGPCIRPNLTKYMVCAQNCVSCHGCTEGRATIKELTVFLRDGTKRSKASRVQDLVWVEVKGREGWTNQKWLLGPDEWSGAIGGWRSVISGSKVSCLHIQCRMSDCMRGRERHTSTLRNACWHFTCRMPWDLRLSLHRDKQSPEQCPQQVIPWAEWQWSEAWFLWDPPTRSQWNVWLVSFAPGRIAVLYLALLFGDTTVPPADHEKPQHL